jgi:hypothetical protein
MSPPDASVVVTLGIAGLSLGLLALWPELMRRAAPDEARRAMVTRLAIVLVAWSGLWFALAASGQLARIEQRPPLFIALPPLLIVGCVVLARSRMGTALAFRSPLWGLVGLQAFRLPLELVMHQAAAEGVMPPQMTFGVVEGAVGLNYDLLTGATALGLAVALRRRPVSHRVVWLWNVLGTVLLGNIVLIAVSSTPLFRAFGDAPERVNSWILYPPFVWLPAVLVGSALLGHLLLFRRLAATQSSSGSSMAQAASSTASSTSSTVPSAR